MKNNNIIYIDLTSKKKKKYTYEKRVRKETILFGSSFCRRVVYFTFNRVKR